MKFTRVNLLVASFAALAMGSACQSAKKPVATLPRQQTQAPAPVPATPPPVQASTEPAPSVTPEAAVPKTDAVDDLLAQVDQEYQAGQANFKAGKVDAAKQNFTHGSELLNQSSINVNSDTRLQRKLDEITPRCNSSTSRTSSRPKLLPSSSRNLPHRRGQRSYASSRSPCQGRAEAEIKFTHSDLPLMMTDQVAGYINYFSGRGRGTLERALVRSGRYHEMIQRTLKKKAFRRI